MPRIMVIEVTSEDTDTHNKVVDFLKSEELNKRFPTAKFNMKDGVHAGKTHTVKSSQKAVAKKTAKGK